MNAFINDSLPFLQQIHFLRSDWFYAFIPLSIYLLLSYFKKSSSKNWQSIIDPQLHDFVLETNNQKQHRYPLFLVFIALSLCITALAGPVYKKLPQPVYQEKSALIILFDLSQSMNSTDVKPSRLARAKLELLDILKTRKTGQTAFIVYAADAFTVTPLTDDNATIANLIPSLETNMMPAQGSDLSKALAKSFSLFTQAGVIKGNILLITDDIHQRDEAAIKKLLSQGHRLSIFGIGTTQGGPIPLDGGFLLDKQGAIVIPKLQPSKLQQLALAGGGIYTSLTAGDNDTLKLTRLFESTNLTQESNTGTSNLNADIWQEEGHWLLVPLLFFAALWARKGWIAIAILFVLPLPQPTYANSETQKSPSVISSENNLIDVDNLWSSKDQKAMRAFNNGDTSNAAKQFKNPEWKASALYKSGDFQGAAETLKENNTSDGQYNRGNALAKLGNYKEAINAYDKAIELNENNMDAKHNREQVEQALKKQSDSSQNDQDQDGQDQDDQNQSNKESSDKNNSDEKKPDKEDADKQKSDKNTENQDSKQQGSDKKDEDKQGEDNQDSENNKSDNNENDLKQRDAQQENKQQQEEQKKYEQDQEEAAEEEKNKAEDASDEKEDNNTDNQTKEIEIIPAERSITEAEKATEQWLKRIPDDPGGLLKRKFLYQYNRIPNQTDDKEPW